MTTGRNTVRYDNAPLWTWICNVTRCRAVNTCYAHRCASCHGRRA